jgi:hypothetical protein
MSIIGDLPSILSELRDAPVAGCITGSCLRDHTPSAAIGDNQLEVGGDY